MESPVDVVVEVVALPFDDHFMDRGNEADHWKLDVVRVSILLLEV